MKKIKFLKVLFHWKIEHYQKFIIRKFNYKKYNNKKLLFNSKEKHYNNINIYEDDEEAKYDDILKQKKIEKKGVYKNNRASNENN